MNTPEKNKKFLLIPYKTLRRNCIYDRMVVKKNGEIFCTDNHKEQLVSYLKKKSNGLSLYIIKCDRHFVNKILG